jgi:O-methyltransferase
MKTIPGIRDLATVASYPRLRQMVQRSRAAGLETLLDYQRLALLAAAVRLCRDLEGDAVECGSYRGGGAALIGQVLEGTGKTVHVCDSFEGLPAPGEKDNFHHEGDFNDTSAARVRDGLRSLGISAELHVGFFDQTLPALAGHRFAFAHIDVDLYSSVRECLEFCYPRMSAGGIMIFDDYAAPTCHGAKAAVDEFFAERPERVVCLSEPAHAVRVGDASGSLRDDLRREVGGMLALPLVGESLLRG